MIYFLLITSFTVSIDSFFCGFSLSFNKGKKIAIVLGISLVVLIMTTLATYFARIVANLLPPKFANFGGIILIGIGLFNLLKKEGNSVKKGGLIKQSLITGFAVGLDGAFASLSLAIMGLDSVLVPLTITAMHAIFISVGILLSKTSLFAVFDKFGFLPPAILIVLGLIKTVGFFI